jgi:N-acetylmuramoyl-L-alanine amidase
MNLIVIDAGHGGTDPGAIANGVCEKDLNLKICAALKQKLEAGGIRAAMTRSADLALSLEERCKLADNLGAAFFVSVHCNAAPEAGANGIEVYHHPQSAAGAELAQAVYDRLMKLGRRGRGVQSAEFYVLKRTKMPACLVECGFVSNPEESAWIGKHTAEIAGAIADALIAIAGGTR